MRVEGRIYQVTDDDKEKLIAKFSYNEIREAIFQMEHNKVPGPDGFPAEFYQAFWDLIKNDLMAMFVEFHNGTLPLYSLNFGIITLLPKKDNAVQIQQYRPICLLNLSFKISTKVEVNRLTQVADKVIRPTQSAFMPGRYILEGVVILHETLHELHKNKMNGVILKLDFEKAYDKVKWSFLQQTLKMKGFPEKWSSWIESFVSKRSIGVKVNDDIGIFFQTKKGLRQGDPLSPLLFNLVADMLAVMIARAKQDGQISGLLPHLVDDGISILQYADDTIIFMDHNFDEARDMKLILTIFEQLSGLKINYHKSELFCFGEAKKVESDYMNIFGCQVAETPLTYLGIPLHYKRISNKDWKIIEDRFERKLSTWKGKLLSYGGRLTLINSVLSNLSVYMLSFFEIPKEVLEKLNFYRSRFF